MLFNAKRGPDSGILCPVLKTSGTEFHSIYACVRACVFLNEFTDLSAVQDRFTVCGG